MRRCLAPVVLAALAQTSFGCMAAEDTQSQPAATERTPLIGGTPDAVTRAVVALVTGVDGGEQGGCTGTLLAPNLVLTARHCIAPISSSDGSVNCSNTTFGAPYAVSSMLVTWDDNLHDGVPGSAQYEVAEVRTTPGVEVCGADLALLILQGDGVPAAITSPIAPRLNDPSQLDEAFDAVGYGITDPEDEGGETFGERLRVEGLRVACIGGSAECDRLAATDAEWAALSPVCGGDSGGPALDTVGRVIGVASRGDEGCNAALYTHPSAYAGLIRSAAEDAARRRGDAPPDWADPSAVDAGAADSGSEPDASPDDAGMGESPLGDTCTGPCPNDYACFSENNEPPGICVPRCNDISDVCPAAYRCSPSVGACIPDQETTETRNQRGGGGCSLVIRPESSRIPATWLGFSLVAVGVWRRRIRRKS